VSVGGGWKREPSHTTAGEATALGDGASDGGAAHATTNAAITAGSIAISLTTPFLVLNVRPTGQ